MGGRTICCFRSTESRHTSIYCSIKNGEKRKITLHRNLLLPIGTLNLSDSLDQTVTSKKPTPAPRRKKNTDQRITAAVAPESRSEETDESYDDKLLCRKVNMVCRAMMKAVLDKS